MLKFALLGNCFADFHRGCNLILKNRTVCLRTLFYKDKVSSNLNVIGLTIGAVRKEKH